MSNALVLVSVLGGALGAAPIGTDVEPRLELSRVVDLDPLGDVVTVTGTGYDPGRGIYVAVCAMPPPGEVPTPCGGGIDLTGESRASVWISSHPPDYGDGLAQPYGPDGSFEVEVSVSAMLTPTIDCREVQCAIVTRADHTRLVDRSLDVVLPIWFRSAQPEPEPEPELEPEPEPEVVLPPPRGTAPTWPVWAASGAAALGLVAVHPRFGRRSRRAERSARSRNLEVPQ